MNCYRVRLNGQNFLMNFGDSAKKFGFYTTREVEASSLEEAKLKAVEIIRNDEILQNNILNERDDAPMVFLESIELFKEDEEKVEAGFTFYAENK